MHAEPDDVRPLTPPNGSNDYMEALIMGGTLGCHGAISQPATEVSFATPAAFPVAPKRPLPPLPFPSNFPVAPEPLQKRPDLGEGPWKHAGLLKEYGGIKQCRHA